MEIEIKEEVEIESKTLVKQAQEMQVITIEQYKISGEFFKSTKKLQGLINEVFDPIIAKAHAAHKEALEQKGKQLAPILQAEKMVTDKMLIYQKTEKARAKAEEDRLAEIQKKETKRLEKIAEEAEEKAKELQKQAETLQETNPAEAEKLKLRAEKATERAETITEQAQQTQAITPIVEVNIPKIKGVASPDIWKHKIEDFKALLTFCLANLPSELIMENSVALGKLARATKGTLTIPGVTFYKEGSIRGSR